MLDFEQFKDYTADHIKDYLPDEFQASEVRINNVLKNNGKELSGLVVLAEGTHIAPTVYLEPFYERYQEGASLGTLMGQIAETTVANQLTELPGIDLGRDLLDFDAIKDRLVVALVNAQRNEELLSGIPYTMHEDLAAIYKISLDMPGQMGAGTITVTGDMMERWGIDTATLDAAARENSLRILPPVCQTMAEVMTELMRDQGMPDELVESMMDPSEDIGMWVITNEHKTNGASAMIYSDVLQQLSEKLGENLFILPSSTHEVLAVPESMGSPEMLADMVSSINESEVLPEEQLSDHVYRYDADKRELKLADTTVEQLGLVAEPAAAYGAAQEENQARRPNHR